MPFKRPTLAQLIKQAQAAFDAKLPGGDARLQKSVLNVVAAVSAALANGAYGYLDYLANNTFVQSADEYHVLRMGQLYGLSPMPAVAAAGNALFTGTLGTDVPLGTQLADSGGNFYVTTADTPLGVGNTSIPIVASAGGAFGNIEDGTPLYLTSAIAGVTAQAAVDGSGLSGGLDAESIGTAFRARLVARIQSPPGGSGTKADYEKWTRGATAGITRITVEGALRGAGTVDVRFVFDGRASIAPLAGDLAAVLAVLQANAPLTDVAGIQAIAPVLQTVDYTLPVARFTTADQQASAIDALTALHLSLPIGAGLAIQSAVIPALTSARGNSSAGAVLTTPAADIAADPTKLLTLGIVTFS